MKRAIGGARRVSAISAILLVLLAVVGPAIAGAQTPPVSGPPVEEGGDEGGGEGEVGRPGTFSGVAAATGVHYEADSRSGIAVIPEIILGDFPDGLSKFDSAGNAEARASTFFPGRAVTEGPGLACGQGADQAPGPACTTPYPLTAVATGNTTDAEIGTGQKIGEEGSPFAANASSAKAHADRTFVSTDALVTGYSSHTPTPPPALPDAPTLPTVPDVVPTLPGGGSGSTTPSSGPKLLPISSTRSAQAQPAPAPKPPGAVQADSIEAHTRQDFEGPMMVVRADARLDGVSLAAGAVTIDSIVVRSVSRTKGKEPPKTVSSVSINGVRALKQPATIDQDGVRITDTTQGKAFVPAFNEQLKKALEAQGVEIRSIGTSNQDVPDEGKAAGDAAGVLVTVQANLKDVPGVGDVYFAKYMLGRAVTEASASADIVGEKKDEEVPVDDAAAAAVATGGETGTDATGGGAGGDAASTEEGAAGTSGTSGSRAAGPDGAAATNEREAAGPRRDGLLGLLGGAVADRVALLYGAAALGSLAFLLGFRPMLPARLPRGT